ncbi:hypothetical protein [Nocardioides sp. LHG3406-4]|uniref:hypothetical protein n=1 Tax=Nocardioides sp. LHG3406-4 TaxID=2804575 RepID=UPI003CEE81E9
MTPTASTEPAPARPVPLTVAASLVAAEGGLLVVLGILEAFALSSARVTMGVTTAAFFAAYGVGLVICAWGAVRLRPWSRSPIVLGQLIQLGLAWNFRGGDTTPVAVALVVVALIVLAGILHPASTRALFDRG